MLFEQLEARRFLSAVVTATVVDCSCNDGGGDDDGGDDDGVGGGDCCRTLIVRGTDGPDSISVQEQMDPSGGNIVSVTVGPNPEPIGLFLDVCEIVILGRSGGDTIEFRGETIGAFVSGGSGGDTIIINDEGTGSSVVRAGAGDDLVNVEAGHNTVVFGGEGKDNLNGALVSGNAFLFGGAGNDIFIVQGDVTTGERSFAFGGPGFDTAIVGANAEAEAEVIL